MVLVVREFLITRDPLNTCMWPGDSKKKQDKAAAILICSLLTVENNRLALLRGCVNSIW